MKPRCLGKNYRTFICRLDADHDGPCQPYRPPTVDEWRAASAAAAELERGLREALAYECGRANRLERELRAALELAVGPDLGARVVEAVQREREG